MPIVMDLGFGEDGDAGDRGMVNRQATRGHEIYPGSGPRRENPTPACLLLITAEPKVQGCADAIWHRGVYAVVCEIALSSCPPSLYIEIGRSQAQIESVTGFRVCPFEYSIYSSLVLQGSEGVMVHGHPKVFMGWRMFSWAFLGLD